MDGPGPDRDGAGSDRGGTCRDDHRRNHCHCSGSANSGVDRRDVEQRLPGSRGRRRGCCGERQSTDGEQRNRLGVGCLRRPRVRPDRRRRRMVVEGQTRSRRRRYAGLLAARRVRGSLLVGFGSMWTWSVCVAIEPLVKTLISSRLREDEDRAAVPQHTRCRPPGRAPAPGAADAEAPHHPPRAPRLCPIAGGSVTSRPLARLDTAEQAGGCGAALIAWISSRLAQVALPGAADRAKDRTFSAVGNPVPKAVPSPPPPPLPKTERLSRCRAFLYSPGWTRSGLQTAGFLRRYSTGTAPFGLIRAASRSRARPRRRGRACRCSRSR